MLAIMSGAPPDRVPWVPRLGIWYAARKNAGTLPERYAGWSLRDIEIDLRMGSPAKDGRLFRTDIVGVEIEERSIDEMETLTSYTTPVGTVTTRHRGTAALRAAGIGDLQVEFMLKGRADYAVVRYIVEHTHHTATYDEYEAYDREIGDRGYPLAGCGDCPFHHWLRALAGYSNAYYHLHDFPDEVEHLLDVMTERDRSNLWPVIAESPTQLVLHGAHLSSQMTPPPMFERYITPYYREFSAILRERGKTLVMHADNDTSRILGHIEQAGYGMVECFATRPMAAMTLSDARSAWGSRVAIWGGIPSVILEEPYTDHEFERYMEGVFREVAPGDAFILGVSDNVMPGAKLSRLQRIGEMVEELGAYPVRS